jgi:uncharacterized membrane protein YkvI
MNRSQEELDRRWDMHSERQNSIAKAGSLAVTVLNSGSWLALLTQVGSIQNEPIGWVLGFWGLGALLGTLIWVVIYCNASQLMQHDFDRTSVELSAKLDRSVVYGLILVFASLTCFAIGVLMLALNFI